ncbi:alpha/beta hydrolase [Nocardioides sp. NPDC101246]|uniref:alpha/beta hydrolase n=1 Tax=Nocardioides sp. NPDC101246 TaxID=3364336 RepID=UPI003808FFB8
MSAWKDLLDPELEDVLTALPVIDFVDYETFRSTSDAAGAARAAAVDRGEIDVVDRMVGADRAEPVATRVYRPPAGPGLRPAIVHLHGGGFVSGSSDASHARNLELSRELDAVVVSVDYRRSPEHPFPAPLDDCETALRWLVGAAGDLGVDPHRIALHGVSAGGALAAGLAIRVRGDLAPCFQFLSMPITDDRLATASMVRYVDTPVWSRPVGETSWAHYLGDLAPGSPEVPIDAAPGRASVDDLRGLPPAYVAVMGLDPLCDEGLAYAAMLAEAGVPVEVHRFPGAFHAAFTAKPTAEVSRRYLAEEIQVLARALGVER